MTVTRRNFIATASLAVGAATLTSNAIAAIADDTLGRPELSPVYGWDSFLPYVGTDFTFRDLREREMTLTLSDISEFDFAKRIKSKKTPDCFALTFTGRGDRRFVQNTYEVTHFALGTFPLFVTAGAGKLSRTSAYVAVINRSAG